MSGARVVSELVRRCQAGDEAAWEELYRAHAPLVARFIGRLTGPSGPVDDLVQQVFIVVLNSIRRYRGDAALTTWLYGVARKVTARHMRGEHRRRRRDERWAAHDEEVRGATEPAPDAMLAARQELRVVERAVQQLNEAHRVVWVMRELEGLSTEEVAQALDMRVGTVRTRLFTARREILRALEREAAPGADDDAVEAALTRALSATPAATPRGREVVR